MEYVQQVTGRVQAERIGDARALFDALEAHRRELAGQRGFMSMRVARSSEAGGDTLVSIETRWANESSLTGYASGARNAETILEEHGDLLVPDSVTERRMEALETEAESKSRAQLDRLFMAAGLPVAIFALGFAIIYSVSRIYLEMGSEGATVLSIAIAVGILLVAWYFAENAKAPAWQIAAVGTFAAVALIGGTVAAQVRDDPEEEHADGGGEPTPGPGPGELVLELDDNVFVLGGEENPTIEVGANVPVTIQLDNVGTAIHNVHIANPDYEATFCEEGGRDPCSDPAQIDGGASGVITFTLPPGTYDYRCDFHADEMAGQITVVEGGPTGGEPEPGGEPGGPGGEPGGPGGEPGRITLDMDDNVFVQGEEENPELRAPAGTDVTVTLENVGAALHNMHIANPDYESTFCEAGGRDPCSDPDQVEAGDSATLTFNLPAGEYEYRCDFHADEMQGVLTVE